MASGITTDVYSGGGAPANSLVTLTTSGGSFTSADASDSGAPHHYGFLGYQVLTNGSGSFSFTVQHASATGPVTVTAQDVYGAAYGTTAAPQLLQLEFETALDRQEAEIQKMPQDRLDTQALWLQFAVLFLLILLNGFFALAEMAMISARRVRLHVSRQLRSSFIAF